MHTKIHIHPDYARFNSLIRRIIDGDFETKQVFCDNRNLVFRIDEGGVSFVVKKYKLPTVFNRFIYTNFRKSKARRSFEYAGKLLEKGVETPKPIAYIEQKKGLCFHTGYFISEYLPYPELPSLVDLPEEEQCLVKEQFIEFTAYIHDLKIIHKDYNATNIFFYKDGEKYKFALIDINRMSFDKDDMRLWMQGLNQLEMDEVDSVRFIRRYAELRKLNELDCLIVFFKNRKARMLQERLKKLLKKYIRTVTS